MGCTGTSARSIGTARGSKRASACRAEASAGSDGAVSATDGTDFDRNNSSEKRNGTAADSN